MLNMDFIKLKESMLPLQYGETACEALMKKYTPEQLPPRKAMFYHQGVFLSGMENIYYLG